MSKSKDDSLLKTVRATLEKELKNIDANTPLTDKLSIIDRAIKFETLQAKRQDAGLGSGFADDDDD